MKDFITNVLKEEIPYVILACKKTGFKIEIKNTAWGCGTIIKSHSGCFGDTDDKLYNKFLKEFHRLLKENGRVYNEKTIVEKISEKL